MKVLLISGSPKPNGNTVQIMQECMKVIEERGVETELISFAGRKIESCIACGKCVVGCRLMNGSLFMQVRHDRCLNCNECSIGVQCPAQAFRRVPAASPRLLRRGAKEAEAAQARKRAGSVDPQANPQASAERKEGTA